MSTGLLRLDTTVGALRRIWRRSAIVEQVSGVMLDGFLGSNDLHLNISDEWGTAFINDKLALIFVDGRFRFFDVCQRCIY